MKKYKKILLNIKKIFNNLYRYFKHLLIDRILVFEKFFSHKFKFLKLKTKNHSEIVCYRLYKKNYYKLSPIKSNIYLPSLSDSLIQEPNIIRFKNQYYDLTSPGVYRFYRLNDISEQRLVTNGDLECILDSVGYLYTYGYEESFLKSNILNIKKMSKSIAVLGCSEISNNISYILKLHNIENRLITFYSKKKWNSHDDGHTLLEVKNNKGEWFLYDPSFLCMPLLNEEKVSAINLQKKLCNNNLELTIKRIPGNIGHSNFRHSKYDYGFWVDERYHGETNLINWYNRVFGFALFCKRDKCFFSNDDLDINIVNKLKSLGYFPKSFSEIIEIFYKDKVDN